MLRGFFQFPPTRSTGIKTREGEESRLTKDIESQSSIRSTSIGKVNLTGDVGSIGPGSSFSPFRAPYRNTPLNKSAHKSNSFSRFQQSYFSTTFV